MAKNQTNNSENSEEKTQDTKAGPAESQKATEGPKPTEEKKPEQESQKLADLLQTQAFQQFLMKEIVTGNLKQDFTPAKLSTEQERELVTNYNVWVDDGRPMPQMPERKKKAPEKILRVYRRREFMAEFLTAVVDGRALHMGVELVPTYGKLPNGEPDHSTVIAHEKKYTLEYSEAKAKELIARCRKESKSPKFFFVEGTLTVPIKNIENFTRPFDEVLNKITARQPV